MSSKLKVVVEGNIPFIKGLLEPYADVRYLAPDDIDASAVRDADALFVRTRTRCDSALLQGSRCKFVATATIGTDHIDMPWCAANGITVVNAPGCNAPAVAQYVFASLLAIANRPLSQYTIGIVGVGHVGSIVESWAHDLSMNVLVNDPPRQAAESGDKWRSLDEISRFADIITIHTPLDASTRHMINSEFIGSLRRAPIIVNAARGAIVDTPALIDGLSSGQMQHAVIDCWENEPHLSEDLLDLATIATPHIAGYSYEGKVRATRMVVDAFTSHFGLPHINMPQVVPSGAAERVSASRIAASYDPVADTKLLRADVASFESLRNHYQLRHEVI